MKFDVARSLPTAPVLSVLGPTAATLTWTDTAAPTPAYPAAGNTWGDPSGEIGFRIERADNGGAFTTLTAALDRAVADGMDVVNLSFGSPADPGQALLDACNRAASAGIVLVAAAGNFDGLISTADTIIYPAHYSSVIAVGATTMTDERASFSSIGAELDLVAPGVDIYTTTLSGGYTTVTGTSFSAPYVTGAAALLIDDGFSDVRDRLVSTAYDLGAVGFDTFYGYGRVDVHPVAVPAPSAIALALAGLPLVYWRYRRAA